ncbi:hypothetical protein LINPERHAP1_LOCUS37498 [Linum perenne]
MSPTMAAQNDNLQPLLEIQHKLEQRKGDRDAKLTTLERLDRHERDFRAGYIHRNGMLDLLQQSLDKLSFANQAYQKRSIRSTTLEDEIHYQLLNFQMLHGRRRRNSIAAERRLLRETKAACPSVNCGSFEELNSKISGMNYNLGCTMRVNQRDAEKQFAVKLKQLELERETTIVNAAVNGGIWSLWVVQRESEVMRKGHLEVKAEIRRLRSELEVVDEEISCLLMKLCSRRLEKEALPSVCVSIVHWPNLNFSTMLFIQNLDLEKRFVPKKIPRNSLIGGRKPFMESGEDLISELPDGILHNIIHRLSFKDEAAQTIAISRRWQTLWRSYPFAEFDIYHWRSPNRKRDFQKFAEATIDRFTRDSLLRMEILKLSLGLINEDSVVRCYSPLVEQLVDLASRRKAEEVSIFAKSCDWGSYPHLCLPCRLLSDSAVKILQLT